MYDITAKQIKTKFYTALVVGFVFTIGTAILQLVLSKYNEVEFTMLIWWIGGGAIIWPLQMIGMFFNWAKIWPDWVEMLKIWNIVIHPFRWFVSMFKAMFMWIIWTFQGMYMGFRAFGWALKHNDEVEDETARSAVLSANED